MIFWSNIDYRNTVKDHKAAINTLCAQRAGPYLDFTAL